MKKYSLHFNVHVPAASSEVVRNACAEFADSIVITEAQECPGEPCQEFNVSLNTEDPTFVFDACSQVGRIKSVKIDEV